MAKEKCQKCGKESETSWRGAAFCDNCGFICADCAKGRTYQCPRCEKRDLRKI